MITTVCKLQQDNRRQQTSPPMPHSINKLNQTLQLSEVQLVLPPGDIF